MSLKKTKLVVDPQSGKISLARSIPSCPRCKHYAEEITQLRRTIFSLNEHNTINSKKAEQMDVLCEEIAKTKAKLIEKMKQQEQMKKEQQAHSSDNCKLSSIFPNN